MSEHTREPWKQDEWGHVHGCDNEPLLVNGISFPTGNHPKAKEASANARRIVACVNACARMSTEFLEGVALKLADQGVFATPKDRWEES